MKTYNVYAEFKAKEKGFIFAHYIEFFITTSKIDFKEIEDISRGTIKRDFKTDESFEILELYLITEKK